MGAFADAAGAVAVAAAAMLGRSAGHALAVAANAVRTALAHVEEHAAVGQPFPFHHVVDVDRMGLVGRLAGVGDVEF